MQPRRTIEHGPEAGWSSVAVTIAPAAAGKDGFYLTLFPDARPPSTIFLRPQQLQHIVDLAGQAAVTDQQIWDVVAKIPMEPLLPNRSLYPRLRSLLVDAAGPIRAQIRAQLERPQPPRELPPEAQDSAGSAGSIDRPAGDAAESGGSEGSSSQDSPRHDGHGGHGGFGPDDDSSNAG
jgi:hypothetical protein